VSASPTAQPARATLVHGQTAGPVSTDRVIKIRPSSGWISVPVAEMWEARELLYFLVWRDLKVRYKQTALGATWAVIQPLLTMLIFTLVFGRLARLPTEGIPYPLFAYCGLVPWSYFATALTQASNSVVDQGRVITKVYFPRLLVPLAAVVAGLVDLAITLVVLVGMMLYYRITPTLAVLALPGFVLLATLSALAVGLWLSALNARYRDVRHTMQFLIQFWLFATPVAYPSSLLPKPLRLLAGLNPMAGVVEGFRWSLLGTSAPGPLLLVSALAVVLVGAGGLLYFRRMERSFADVI
jgi:lipopolysaccharide transport system permease protein